jgi:hypothetical protein
VGGFGVDGEDRAVDRRSFVSGVASSGLPIPPKSDDTFRYKIAIMMKHCQGIVTGGWVKRLRLIPENSEDK